MYNTFIFISLFFIYQEQNPKQLNSYNIFFRLEVGHRQTNAQGDRHTCRTKLQFAAFRDYCLLCKLLNCHFLAQKNWANHNCLKTLHLI